MPRLNQCHEHKQSASEISEDPGKLTKFFDFSGFCGKKIKLSVYVAIGRIR
jgi:hypothetical protein